MKQLFILCTFCTQLFSSPSFFLDTNEELLKRMYGSDQERYVRTSALIVESLVEKMREAKRREETSSFLSDVLSELGKERGKLAKELGSKDAHFFGALRERSLYRSSGFLTLLSGPFYMGAGKKFINSLEKILEEQGLDFSGQRLFPFQVSEIADLRLVFYHPQDFLLIAKELQDLFSQNDPFNVNFLLGGAEEMELFRVLEENDEANVLGGVHYLETEVGIKKTENTLYLLGTTFFEIDGKEIPLSKLLLQVEVDQKTGALLNLYPPLVLHQEAYYHKEMLREMDRIAEKTILSSEEDSIYQIGLFQP